MTGPSDREALALGKPPSTLTGFPRWTLTTKRTVYRAHGAAYGPWYFSSAPGGRWNLPAPEGTCYLADSPGAALRERLGRRAVKQGATAAEVDASAVSELHVPRPHRLADLCSGRAVEFGVTREIHVMTPYQLTQEWAVALRQTAVQGVRYDARFSTGRDRAYALWGDAGGRTWPDDSSPRTGRQVAAMAGISIIAVPGSVAITPPPA